MRVLFSALILCLLLSSCALLAKPITTVDPETGEIIETTVGDIAADSVEDAGGAVASMIEAAATTATGNPVVGAGAGAALLALLGAGASRMRRRA